MRLLSKRLSDLEAQNALNAGYWITLQSDCALGQTPESAIAEYEAANGFDPARDYIVWNIIDPKGCVS